MLYKKYYFLKLSVISGILFIIISMPFILNILEPSMHGNAYSALYFFITLPLLVVVGSFADNIAAKIFDEPSLYQSNLLTIIFMFIFLIVISMSVGLILDLTTNNTRTKH